MERMLGRLHQTSMAVSRKKRRYTGGGKGTHSSVPSRGSRGDVTVSGRKETLGLRERSVRHRYSGPESSRLSSLGRRVTVAPVDAISPGSLHSFASCV